MEPLNRVVLTLLVFAVWSSSLECQAVKYRAFRVGANKQVTLPCWELLDGNDLLIWIAPSGDIVGPDSHFESRKYAVDFDGSLIVNVS